MAKVAKRRDRYVIDFYDHQGKRRWQTMPAGTTLKAAKDKLREIEAAVGRGVYIRGCTNNCVTGNLISSKGGADGQAREIQAGHPHR